MKQQSRKPPKPHNQPTLAAVLNQQAPISRRGKENLQGQNECNKTQSCLKFQNGIHHQEKNKQRQKSNGANKRPQTSCTQSKIISPHNVLHQTIHPKPAQQSCLTFEESARFLQDGFNCRYSSTKKERTDLKDPQITGRVVQAPKLIVAQEEQHFNRSPMNPFTNKKQKAKSSKSQTLTSSQNLAKSQRKGQQQNKKFLEFLDSSLLLVGNQKSRGDIAGSALSQTGMWCEDEKDLNLKILRQPQSQNVKERKQSSAERNKLQMRNYNFHRKNVTRSETKSQTKKRPNTVLKRPDRNQQHTTSADKIPSHSPRSKGSGKKCSSAQRRRKSGENLVVRSALDMPGNITTLLFEKGMNDSDFSMKFKQSTSTFQRRSGADVKPKRNYSPEEKEARNAKVDKLIKENIRKELLLQEKQRREQREREASSLRRKNLLQQNNQQIRKVNHDKVERRRLKQKEQPDTDTKGLEEALLAVSDGVQKIKEKDYESTQKKRPELGLKQSKKPIQTVQSYTDVRGRTQGMDFIEVRREIAKELRDCHSRASKASSKSKLFSPTDQLTDLKNLKVSKSAKNATPIEEPQKAPKSLLKQENVVAKRSKIRKFMKEKARLMKTTLTQQKSNEMNTFRKMRCNLAKLNEFVQNQMGSGITTPAIRVVARKNKTQRNQHQAIVSNDDYSKIKKQTTPNRVGRWSDHDSLNVSGTNFGVRNGKSASQINKDTLNEDSRLSSIDNGSHNKRKKQDEHKVLSVCFERSASQKNIRKQVRPSNSPKVLIKSSQSKRPRSALSMSGSSKQNGIKRRIAQGQHKLRRPRSGRCEKESLQNSQLNSKMKLEAKGQIVKSIEASPCTENDSSLTLNIKLTEKAAATVIQKEVRKYLGSMGFYEAQVPGTESPKLYSPEQHIVDGRLSLFLAKPTMTSRKSSPGRHSKSSGKTHSRKSVSPPRAPRDTYELVDPHSTHSLKLELTTSQLQQLQKFQDLPRNQNTDQKSPRPADSREKDSWPVTTNEHDKRPGESYHQTSHQSSNGSLFDRNAFQNQFSQRKLQSLLKDNEFQKLINAREECLQFRQQTEMQMIDRQFYQNQLTPRAYKKKKEQIEKWVQVQRKEIEQTKLGFKEEWQKTVQMIEDTQKQLEATKDKINGAMMDSNSYSQTSTHRNREDHKDIKSIHSVLLDDIPPKSYRSGKDPAQVKISDVVDQSDNHSEKHDLHKKLLPSQESSKHQNSAQQESQSSRLQEPSDAFINRLERQTGLLHQNSNQNSQEDINIEEHSYHSQTSIPQQLPHQSSSEEIDDYNENSFKNQIVQIKDLNKLFAKENIIDVDHLSSKSRDSDEDIKISDILKDSSIKKVLNYEEQIIPKEQALQIEQITDHLLKTMIEECLEIPKRGKIRTPPPALPDPEAPPQNDSIIEREEKKEWVDLRQRHLIEAALIRIDAYVNEVVDVLLQFDISDISEHSDFDYGVKESDNYHIQFLKLLTQPIQRQPLDLLELMQKSELGNYQHFETTLDQSKFPILSVDLYLEIEKAREESILQRKAQADSRKLQIWESIHIFNKCIFDAVNESLMKFRPYGIGGHPMPWSQKVRRLQTKVEIASVDTERLFQMVKQEIFRWSQVFCGCLIGPVFYFPNAKTGKDEFDEHLHQEVRERRLTSILTQDQVEQEHHWLNYEFEEAQVKVDLSDMILEQLVSEVIGILNEQ